MQLHDATKWVTESTTVDTDVRNDIAAIFVHMEECYSSVPGLTEQHYSEGSYLWKVFRKQAYSLWQGRERGVTLNSQTLITEMKVLVNEHRARSALCSGARAGPVTDSALLPALPQSGYGSLEAPTASQPSETQSRVNLEASVQGINAGGPLDDDWMNEAFHFVHDLVRQECTEGVNVQLDTNVIPSVQDPVDSSAVYETPEVWSLQSGVESLVKASVTKDVENPVDEFRETEPEAEKGPSKQSGKRKMGLTSEPGVPVQLSGASKRARSGAGTARAEESHDEEAGRPGPPCPVVDPSLLDPVLLKELCNTVWGSCLVMGAAVAAGEPVRSAVRQAVTKGMWDAVSIAIELEDAQGPLETSYRDAVADMDSFTTRL
ncbi:hypothetical protein FRC01_012973 [Tulasnella sp. 417]|nr:hypothetical protein FRC01_012973 [Tulasnella sp. 417]